MVRLVFPFSPRGEGGPKNRMRGLHGKAVPSFINRFEPAAPSSPAQQVAPDLPGATLGRAARLVPSFGLLQGRREGEGTHP